MRAGRYIGVMALAVLLGAGGFFPMSWPGPRLYVGVATAHAQTLTPEQRAQLQAEYDELQKEIAQWQKVLDETKAKKNTLTGDVSALTAQINKAEAEIKQRNVVITQLQSQISTKTKTVQTLEQRLEAGQQSLGKLLREKNEREGTPLAVLALSSGSLSDFFGSINDLDALDAAMQDHFDELRGIKTQTLAEKDALAKQQNAQLDARHEVQVKEKQISADKAQKNELLNIAKTEEQTYSQVLADRQRRATEIRNALFELRDSAGISFQSALEYATNAQAATGVRAAFILGILRQESNLGTNVGQCLLTNSQTGAGKGKNTGTPFKNVMNPTRDVPPFLDLMRRLGVDPYAQVVSCPQSIGYGGAMGPSQFIASTWKSYEKRLEQALGVSVADPWRAKDAVMATALYMQDLGAGTQTYSAEREAAARYYAGGNWQTKGALSYAASVLSFADTYQNNIDFLNNL